MAKGPVRFGLNFIALIWSDWISLNKKTLWFEMNFIAKNHLWINIIQLNFTAENMTISNWVSVQKKITHCSAHVHAHTYVHAKNLYSTQATHVGNLHVVDQCTISGNTVMQQQVCTSANTQSSRDWKPKRGYEPPTTAATRSIQGSSVYKSTTSTCL